MIEGGAFHLATRVHGRGSMPPSAMDHSALQVAVLRLIGGGLAVGFGAASVAAAFEPDWVRGVAAIAAVSCALFSAALSWLRARSELFVRVGLVIFMSVVLTIALTIQPAPYGTISAFVFLGIAVGIASYERIVAGALLASLAVLSGIIAITLRSSLPATAGAVFAAVAIVSLYAVFGFRRAAAIATAAAIADSAKDPLTGMINRRGMLQGVAELSVIAEQLQQRVGCLMLDLDRFKAINDTHGHEAGDRVLVATAQRAAEVARRSDLFVRLGGEEFALFTIVVGTEDLAVIADRLREAIEQLDVSPPVTASVGGALQREGVQFDLDDLLRDADRQLYLAKEAGRNAVRIESA